MISKLISKCEVYTRRWLWLIGVLFAMVILAQYVEFRYGNMVSPLLSDGRTREPVKGIYMPANLSSYLNNSDILTVFGNLQRAREPAKGSGNIVSPLLSDGRTQEPAKGTFMPANLSSYLNDSDNLTVFANLNLTGTISANEKTETAQTSDSNSTSGLHSALDKSSPTKTPLDDVVTKQENGVRGNSSVPTSSASPLLSPTGVNLDSGPVVSKDSGILSVNTNAQDGNHQISPPVEENSRAAVFSISDMNHMLQKNLASSSFSMEPRWSSAVDAKLAEVKSQIVNAPISMNDNSLYAPLYRNVSMFRRSYEIMEQTLKVYIYKEGEKPVFHHPLRVLTGIYASEGWFMKLLEENKHYVTDNPNEAHLFYLPFSSCLLEGNLYVRNSHSFTNLINYLDKYLDLIAAKYPFWNRTGGADHFLVACHDWAPAETRIRFDNCIKALCNADVKEGFRLGKDVSLPETMVRSRNNLLRDVGGNDPLKRPILAFFAGRMHGYLRSLLLKQWHDKDPDIKVFTKLRKSKNNRNYVQYMKSSKYCLCPRGYEVNSPRVVEAIFFECVPVIISDNFVPPFFEILNWESFAVFIQEKDLPNLKNILVSISDRQYGVMQQRVKQVQEHFLWHTMPVKYDIFHMILHSVWYSRVFQVKSS